MSRHVVNHTPSTDVIPLEEYTPPTIFPDEETKQEMQVTNTSSPASQGRDPIIHTHSHKEKTSIDLHDGIHSMSDPETALSESRIDPTPYDDDPFSPKNLALAQNFGALTETRRLLTSVPVGKPKKESWVRASQREDHWVVGSILELKAQNEFYWVVPEFREALVGEPCMKSMRLVLSVDRQGNPFFWPIGLPDSSGRSQPWIDSMTQAATQAIKKWVRVAWSSATMNYEVHIAEIAHEPVWPKETISELLKITFRDKIVSSLDHPIIKSLRGQE